MYQLTHLGGQDTVTGSCHLLKCKGLHILIDCGLAQGSDQVTSISKWPVRPKDIDFVYLTHAHIDHIGRLPELILQGFKGEIICTHPTKALLVPLLEDALSFTDLDFRQKQKVLEQVDELSWGFEFNEEFFLKKGIRFKLGWAGHILGSCFIRFELPDNYSLVFSGDLGSKDTPILCDPDPSEPCDLLVLESTYGDRLHEDSSQRIVNLGKVLNKALADQGKVFIPAFALGRSQELIYELNHLDIAQKMDIPVYLDSPLGLKITRIYHKLSQFWDQEAKSLYKQGNHPLDFDNLYAVHNHEHHLQLVEAKGPMIILAGSGMCTGGRIMDHLRSGITDSRNDLLFVGYQARGTLGRDIQNYARKTDGYVHIDGQKQNIKAQVFQLTGYSAHADQKGLLDFVQAMGDLPEEIRLVHGEYAAKQALKYELRKLGNERGSKELGVRS